LLDLSRLNDVGKDGWLVCHDAFTDDELSRDQTDLGGQASQAACGGGTGQITDLRISAGRDGGLPGLEGRSLTPRVG
jgi:hypothetical protein